MINQAYFFSHFLQHRVHQNLELGFIQREGLRRGILTTAQWGKIGGTAAMNISTFFSH